MSIINTFDPEGRAIIDPHMAIQPIEDFPEVVISVFSSRFYDLILSTHKDAEQIGTLTAGRRIPIHRLTDRGRTFGFYQSPLGGPGAGAILEEILALGAKKVLFYGSCGALDKNIIGGRLIVPIAAYRDEGTSYHYMPASEFIDIASARRLAEVFDSLNLPYDKTKTWTTDSFYRETDKNVAARLKAGCSVVEMECASIMAVAQFRGAEVYQFLYAADCLDEGQWDKRTLGGSMPADMRERIARVGFEVAARL